MAHLSLLALILAIHKVHPFHPPPPETVSVDIVTPDELKNTAAELAPPPLPAVAETAKEEAANKEVVPPRRPSAAPKASSPRQASPPPERRDVDAQQKPQPVPPQPNFKPPEPDVTIKYGVMLGLPDALPPAPKDILKDSARENDGGDAKDSVSARLPANVIAEFRRHLKSCAKLPDAVAPTDNVHIRLRAVMTTDGMLARAPILIEASASAKGPILMQSARSALEACQPYTMLPADKYQEWKVLDLTFTPHDFNAS
ncbi:hypothetical protein [Bradyrhizobium sp.]|uniref:hypothetical protein n=1 Tax=Bradyrhizobium sp. TaxID=376 RepID=UPI00344F2D57